MLISLYIEKNLTFYFLNPTQLNRRKNVITRKKTECFQYLLHTYIHMYICNVCVTKRTPRIQMYAHNYLYINDQV